MTDGSEHHTGPATAARGGVTDTRVAAADVCADLRAGELLDTSFERRVESLDARDRRWTQELLYGMLRRRAWLDAALSERVRGGLARLDPDLYKEQERLAVEAIRKRKNPFLYPEKS